MGRIFVSVEVNVMRTAMPSRRLPASVRASLRASSPARKKLRRAALAVACVLAPVAVALACGWEGPSESVRFSGGGGEPNERRYARLPPITLGDARPGEVDDSHGTFAGYGEWERHEKVVESAWEEATRADALADRDAIKRARARLRDYLAATEHEREGPYRALETQRQRNAASDLIDAFSALDAGSPPEHLRAYAKARAAYDALAAGVAPTPFHYYPPPTPAPRNEADTAAERSSLADAARRAVDEIPADRNLADNAGYLRGAILYSESKYEEAARAFESVAARRPRGERRDAALLMAGLAHTKRSGSFRADDGTATASAPCADCRDEAWHAARSAFSQLLADYPRGRFRLEARGRLAYLDLRVGRTAEGIAEYYRMLAEESDEAARAEALISLRLARRRVDPAAMRRVEAELADEPPAALVYAYHSIYNYAQSFSTYALPPALEEKYDEEHSPEYGTPAYEAREREKEKSLEDFKREELRRVADFAAAMLRRHPRARVGAEFALRLAEANFELDEPRAAREFAARALASGLRGERRAEALWVRGVSEYRLKDFDAARRTLLAVVNENPRGRLEPGARRLVAMISEDAGDLDAALEQYLALGYTADAAYLIDVLMTPAELSAFIERRPAHEKIDQLNYALGVRHLRDGDYAAARAAYARVRTSGGEYYSWWHRDSDCGQRTPDLDDYNPHCASAKEPVYDDGDEGDGVLTRWVLRDLRTAEDLEGFDRAYAAAPDEEARAEALYQKASYLYEADLLFYNTAAWQGGRTALLGELDASHLYRLPGEAQQLFAYVGRHDMAARALELYLETVARFPRTRAARDALYTAAVCHNRLSNYNHYWRDKYASGLHAGRRLVGFADVRAAYPDYRFPVGSDYGWQPATRTMYGKPAWPAPPKPRPRLTRPQRVKQLLLARWPSFYASASYHAARAFHWLTVGLVLAACLLSARVASRSRRRWRAHLARTNPSCKPARESLRDWLREVKCALARRAKPAGKDCARGAETMARPAPWLLHEPKQTRVGLLANEVFRLAKDVFHRAGLISRATARTLWHYVSPLTHDARGRHTLFANAAAHAALFALLLALVRMIYAP